MCQLASEAAAVEILFRCERALHFIFEQPASSWAFKLPTRELFGERKGWKWFGSNVHWHHG